MSKKSITIVEFNNNLELFIKNIQVTLRDPLAVKAVTVAGNKLKALRSASPKAIPKLWYDYVTSVYYTQICEGNYNYFLNKDYTNEVNNTGSSDSNSALEMISNIKNAIVKLPEEQKKRILEELKCLTMANQSMKINGTI